MAEVIKTKDQAVTENLVKELVGKHIHVPTNMHDIKTEDGTGEVNAWFGGRVAGYEKAEIHFDYEKQEFMDEPSTIYNILLCDGLGYVLSNRESEVNIITEEEFQEMVEEHKKKQKEAQAKAEAKNSLILPDNKKLEVPEGDKKIIQFPGR